VGNLSTIPDQVVRGHAAGHKIANQRPSSNMGLCPALNVVDLKIE
jgi:hypothetical protein